jgi:hypothetical protein
MSSDGSVASIDITGIAFVVESPPPEVPLAGWEEVASLTNADYTLDSSASNLSLGLEAVDTNSKVTIRQLTVSALSLDDYGHIDVSVSGTANAKILLRFFLNDGTSFDVVYWKDPVALDALTFDLSPYAGKSLRGDVYIAVMSADGAPASINITHIAFVA